MIITLPSATDLEYQNQVFKMMDKIDPIKKNNVTIVGNLNANRSILFVHGFGTTQSAWSDVAAAFLTDFRVILFDNAGARISDSANFAQHNYINLAGYVNDLLDICKALKLNNTILIGHSVGAMIGLLAVAETPGFFSALIMIGASPRYLNDDGYYGGFTHADLNELYRSITISFTQWADTFSSLVMANHDKPNFAKHFAETIKGIAPESVLTILHSIFQSDHRADLDKIFMPTLIVQSTEDLAVPLEVANYLHEHIKESQLQIINATGHLPHISAPDEVVTVIKNFIYN